MAFGDPYADPFGIGGGVDPFAPARATRQRRRARVATPEEEQSIISQIGSNALSGLQAVGNVLDTPGGFIRDIAAGNNPFLGIFDPSARASGRDVLTAWGATEANDPNAWEAADFAGFGLELLLDPLLPLAGGAKALGAGGKLASKAGILGDLAKVAPLQGKRTAQVTNTLGDLMRLRPGEMGPEAIARQDMISRLAQREGVDLGEVINQPLGGVASYFGKPFGGERLAGAVDRVGEALRYGNVPGTRFSPGQALGGLLSARAGDAVSRVGQETIMPQLYDAGASGRAKGRGVVAEATETLKNYGGNLIDEDQHMALRRIFEGVDMAPNPETEQMVRGVSSALQKLHQDSYEWGVKVSDFYDPKIGYFPRFLSTQLKQPGKMGAQSVASTFDPSSMGREPFLKQIEGGTSTIAEIAQDDTINTMIAGNAPVEDIAGYIRQQYGKQVPETFVRTLATGKKATAIEFASRPEEMAGWLKGLSDEARELGVFGNNPMQDLNVRLQNGYESLETAQTILTNLANPDLLNAARVSSKTPGQTVKMGSLLKNLGFEYEQALQKFADIGGLPSDKDGLKAIAQMEVPADLAGDLTRKMEGFKGPKAVGPIIQAIDSVTNLFKAGVTSVWPAFHTRNLTSGQYRNWEADMFSGRSVQDADAIIRGRHTDLSDVPIVKDMLGPNYNQQQAEDLIRKLVFQYEVFGKYSGQTGEYGAAQLAGAQGSGITDLLQQFPGGLGGDDPIALSAIPAKAIGIGDEVDWNPLSVRGVRGRVESTFGPAVAGEHVGQYVEGLNRLAPFIHELRKGVSPAEAAKRVAAAQIDYGGRALTAFEREVMTRVMPFYKFSKGNIPYTLRQLWEQPGGKTAQSIRAINSMRGTDALTPPEVAEGASVPLGENAQGDPRYLTRFGFMFEDPVGLAGQAISNPRGAMLELAGMLNPLIKGPAEYATNQLFFQGGRPLDEAEGRVGRTISNILGYDEPMWDSRGGTGVLEQVVSNSPLARLSTALGTVTDRRKYDAYGLPLAANLLTGLKVTDVPQARQDAILRERLNEDLLTNLGGKAFSRVYIPADDLESMSPAQQEEASNINALMTLLQQRAKARREKSGR